MAMKSIGACTHTKKKNREKGTDILNHVTNQKGNIYDPKERIQGMVVKYGLHVKRYYLVSIKYIFGQGKNNKKTILHFIDKAVF